MITISNSTKVLSRLLPFTHGTVTNLPKRTLTNADAALYTIAHLTDGDPVPTRSIQAVLNEWRGAKLAFTYLFNKSHSGGYGFVGENIDVKGHWMRAASSGHDRRKVRVTSENFWRRTFWYRVKPGMYAPTYEGHRRLGELSAFFG